MPPASDSGDEVDESLTKQLLNMLLENNALTPYIIIWIIFNILVLTLLLYVSIRVSIR